MKNHIEIYEKNTQTIAVYVSGLSNLTFYDAYDRVLSASEVTQLWNGGAGI